MFLLDSNILIYYLEGNKKIGVLVDKIQSSAFISVISITELLAKPTLTKNQITFIFDFLHQFSILDFDSNIASVAAQLKRDYHLTFPDAILAATAKVFQLQFISKDKIFQKVDEIKVIDPAL